MSAHDAPPDPDQIPQHTTPTWEVELLISGVAVFAMLQLAGWLDQRIFALLPRFDRDWAGVIVSLYIYLKAATVLLAFTFIAHLTLRAHWIALVGMHSVFPAGVRWDRLRIGPAKRSCDKNRLGTVDAAIERADNRATVVFAMGVMVGSTLILGSVVVAVILAVLIAIRPLIGSHADIPAILLGLTLLLFVPYGALRAYDRKKGPQWPEDGWKRRACTRIFRMYARFGIGRSSYAWTLLSSNIGERRTIVIIYLVFVPVLAFAGYSVVTLDAPDAMGNYGPFPQISNSARALDNAHYDDKRDPHHGSAVPYIQSAIVTDPYVQLVVPWQPTHDNGAVQRQCAAALALRDPQARAVATLDCAGTLHAVSLDGQPLGNLHYAAGSDPRTRQPALVAMLDVRALTPGRHQLTVMRAPDAPGHKSSHDKVTRYVIPFWR